MSDWTAETAKWYAENYGEYPTNQMGIEQIDFKDNSIVVDIGCGTGSALRHAAENFSGGALIGIDPVPEMLGYAQQHTQEHPEKARFSFLLGSAEKLPVDDNSADIVLAFDSYDHWSDKQLGFAEVRRVLRTGGQFIVVKDGEVPEGSDNQTLFSQALPEHGFSMVSEQTISKDDVSFMIWTSILA